MDVVRTPKAMPRAPALPRHKARESGPSIVEPVPLIWWQAWWDRRDRGMAAKQDNTNWGSHWRGPGGQDQGQAGTRARPTEAGEPEQEGEPGGIWGGEGSLGVERLGFAPCPKTQAGKGSQRCERETPVRSDPRCIHVPTNLSQLYPCSWQSSTLLHINIFIQLSTDEHLGRLAIINFLAIINLPFNSFEKIPRRLVAGQVEPVAFIF